MDKNQVDQLMVTLASKVPSENLNQIRQHLEHAQDFNGAQVAIAQMKDPIIVLVIRWVSRHRPLLPRRHRHGYRKAAHRRWLRHLGAYRPVPDYGRSEAEEHGVALQHREIKQTASPPGWEGLLFYNQLLVFSNLSYR